MARLTLTLLGGFRAHLDPGAPLAFPTRKAQALLSYLVMPAGEPHSRDKLASLLWGSTVETTARTSLRQTLYSLRRILRRAEGEPLHADGNLISVDPGAVSLDVLEFEQCVQEGTPQPLAEAVTLYRGDLLEGLTVQEPPFEDWLRGERPRSIVVARQTDFAGPGQIQQALEVDRQRGRQQRRDGRPVDDANDDLDAIADGCRGGRVGPRTRRAGRAQELVNRKCA